MKEYPTTDYPVGVRREAWDVPPGQADLYGGIFQVTFNRVVDVCFIPDVTTVAPPWDTSAIPEDVDHVTSAVEARMATAMFASYVVTPNDTLAGTHETSGEADERVVILYVTTADFARYTNDLDGLSRIVGGLHPDRTVSTLRDFAVIRFLERDVVAAGLLSPRHAVLLGAA